MTTGATAISAGSGGGVSESTCAVVNGGAQCWGYNNNGQLGINSTTQVQVPTQVTGLPANSGVTAIGINGNCGCAVVSGAVQCWGDNSQGCIGNGNTTASLVPVATSITTGATAVSVGNTTNCAIVSGAAWCWGFNGNGQIGNGNHSGYNTTPVQVTGLTANVTSISVGGSHTCAVMNGAAYCWGTNFSGQLAESLSVAGTYTPYEIISSGVSSISAGADYTCAVMTSGAMQCWGSDVEGKLGDGAMMFSTTPVPAVNF